jgi:chromosome partitioning protein
MARRIALLNEKGGSCKTTLTVNVGSYLAIFRRKRVLLIDLDSQGQIGKALGIDVRHAPRTTLDLLCDPTCDPLEAIVRTRIGGLDVVVANKDLGEFPLRVASDPDRERKLAQRMPAFDGYDYVFLDSPPSQGLTTLNILLAAREIVVPVNLSYFALDGCAEVVESIARVRERYGRDDLELTLVVPTLYRNTNLANEILERLRQHFPRTVSRQVLGFNVKIDEAQSHAQTIWEYAPSSPGAQMIEAIAREIERRSPRRAPSSERAVPGA